MSIINLLWCILKAGFLFLVTAELFGINRLLLFSGEEIQSLKRNTVCVKFPAEPEVTW